MKIRKILSIIIRFATFVGALYLWILYAYNTLDRSEEAQRATDGGYLPDKYSFLILAFIIFFFLAKPILSRKLSFTSVVSKLIFIIFFIIGIYIFVIAL